MLYEVITEKILRQILDAEIPYHSVCFKDATGTANPQKIYDTINRITSYNVCYTKLLRVPVASLKQTE